MYIIELQLGIINLASYILVLISHTIMFASLCCVPIIRSRLSSVKAKAETSGEIAVNRYSSGLRKVCFIIESSDPSVLCERATMREPAE